MATRTSYGLRRLLQYPGALFALQVAGEVTSAIVGVGIFWALWSYVMKQRTSTPVDRDTCSCSCWDAVYRDGHSRGPEYKSVYFNVDEYTGPIFMVGTAGAVLLNAAVRALAGIIWRRRMRWLAFVALCTCIYPIFYGLWMAVNYMNDRFFPMWNMQLYFTVTELVVSLALLILCDRDIPVAPGTVWTVIALAGAHAARSPLEQFYNAASGVFLMLVSDVIVLIIVLTILLRETLRTDRQGCAWALVYVSCRHRNAVAAARGTQKFSTSVATALPIERDLEQVDKRESDSDLGKAGVTETDSSLAPASPVPAYTDAAPTYSWRWVAADALVAFALIILQAILVRFI